MKIQLVDKGGRGKGGTLELADTAFGVAFNEPLVHQVVTAYLAGGRSGTKAQKNRSDVSGSGKKPFEQKVNRKMYRGALRSVLSELLRQERVIVAAELGVKAPKTKELKSQLDAVGF